VIEAFHRGDVGTDTPSGFGRYVTGTEWVTGSNDGTLALWSQLKKKPAWRVHDAHRTTSTATTPGVGVAPVEAGWIQSVAVCRGSDLVVSCLWYDTFGKVELMRGNRAAGGGGVR